MSWALLLLIDKAVWHLRHTCYVTRCLFTWVKMHVFCMLIKFTANNFWSVSSLIPILKRFVSTDHYESEYESFGLPKNVSDEHMYVTSNIEAAFTKRKRLEQWLEQLQFSKYTVEVLFRSQKLMSVHLDKDIHDNKMEVFAS